MQGERHINLSTVVKETLTERVTFQRRLEGCKEQGMILFGGRAFLAEGTASSRGWNTPGVLNHQAGGWSAGGKGESGRRCS